jgi:c-di-GMP-related signal transduction protein
MSDLVSENRTQWLSGIAKLDTDEVLNDNVRDLLAEFDQEEISLRKVKQLMTLEPVLTAKVLRIANSPFYGFHREVQDIEEAIVVIGAVKLKTLVYSSLVLVKSQNEDHRNFVKHSLVTAHYAKLVAESLGHKPEVPVTAGLLHVLPVLLNYREDIHSILSMQVLHEATHSLLEQLQLPEPIVTAATELFQPQSRNRNTLMIRFAFNLSLLRLGKHHSAFKHLINTEHDFNKLKASPMGMAKTFYQGFSEVESLIQMAGEH